MVMRKIIIMMIIKIMTATWGSEATLLTDEFGKTHWAYLAKTFFFLSVNFGVLLFFLPLVALEVKLGCLF